MQIENPHSCLKISRKQAHIGSLQDNWCECNNELKKTAWTLKQQTEFYSGIGRLLLLDLTITAIDLILTTTEART